MAFLTREKRKRPNNARTHEVGMGYNEEYGSGLAGGGGYGRVRPSEMLCRRLVPRGGGTGVKIFFFAASGSLPG